MRALDQRPDIRGFTTNPTLMHKAGVTDYRRFARDVLAAIPDAGRSRSRSSSDDFAEMERQAREIATWGAARLREDSRHQHAGATRRHDLIHRLSHSGVQVNVTAVLTLEQVERSRRRAGRRRAVERVGVRGPDRRYRPRSGADDAGRSRMLRRGATRRADLGEPARAAERLSGRRASAATSSRSRGHPEEARSRRQGPERAFARYRQDVPQRRGEGRLRSS